MELYFCTSKNDITALQTPCGDGIVARTFTKNTRFGPLTEADLVDGCKMNDMKEWIPINVKGSNLYVHITDTIQLNGTTTCPKDNNGESLPLGLSVAAYAAIGGAIVLLVLCCVIFCVLARRSKKSSHHDEVGTPLQLQHDGDEYSTSALAGANAPQLTIDSDVPGKSGTYVPYTESQDGPNTDDFVQSYIIPRNQLQLNDELGRGGYGVVYLGKYLDHTVAVKCISEGLSQKDRDDFEAEAKLLQCIRPHENVVGFQGVAFDDNKIMIVLEYLSGGSLIDVLESPMTITREKVFDWLQGICRGMIHLRAHGVIHRDLAARNIMLGANGTPKVTDFGMSRFVDAAADSQHVTKSNVGPLKWMSPESLLDKVWSEKTDIWAFGVLMYEIIAREEPYPDLEPVQVAAQICRDGITLEAPATYGKDLCDLLRNCMQWEADDRPTFVEIEQTLTRYRNYPAIR